MAWQPRTLMRIIVSLLGFVFTCVGLLWLSSSFPFPVLLAMGILVGIASMASLFSMQVHRSRLRVSQAIGLAQISKANNLALRSLLTHQHFPSWILDDSNFHKVRWVNAELNEVWSFFKEAVSGLLKLQLQETLNEFKTGVIENLSIKSINLGSKSPYIDGIKVFEEGKDKIILEVQVDWRHNKGQYLDILVQTTNSKFTTQIKDFVIYSVVRIIFTSLRDEVPGFGAAVFSLQQSPLIDFQSKFLSGDANEYQEVQKAVDSLLLAVFTDLLVWPSRFVVPVLPGDYRNLEVTPMGYLYVELVEADQLMNKEITGKSDPYVVLYIRRRHGCIKKSSQMMDTCLPVWGEKFVLDVDDQEVQKLTVSVMNGVYAGFNLSGYIGTVDLPLKQFKVDIVEDIWVNLNGDPQKLCGKSAGRVHLRLQFRQDNLMREDDLAPSESIQGEELENTRGEELEQSNMAMDGNASEEKELSKVSHWNETDKGTESLQGIRETGILGTEDVHYETKDGVPPLESDREIDTLDQLEDASKVDTKSNYAGVVAMELGTRDSKVSEPSTVECLIQSSNNGSNQTQTELIDSVGESAEFPSMDFYQQHGRWAPELFEVD